MNYKLKVLSPLHIGCGEEYSGLSYLMDKRKNPPLVSIINEDLIFKMLNDSQMKKFVAWLEGEQFPNLFLFFRNILNDNFTLQNQLQKKAIYTIPNYAGEERLRGINSFIKQMNQPYIPGTEIKGAIRTAVLYCALLDNNELSEWLIKEIKDFDKQYKSKIELVKNKRDLRELNPKNKREKLSGIKKELENAMSVITSRFQEKVLCCKPKDAKYDVMKYVQVGDSDLLDAGNSLAVSYVKPFNISGKPITIFYEYIKPDTEICLSMLALENIRTSKIEKMGFDDKQKNIVSSMDAIFNYCYRFSNDLLDEEISFFQAKGKRQIVDQLTKIKSMNKPEAPVLRIGKDEGYNSLTVGLAVKKLDNALYENVLIHATKNKSYDSEHGGPMPKSRKIVYWNGEETTAGWVQLIPKNDSEPQTNFKNNSGNHTAQEQKPATSADLSKLQGMFNVKVKHK